MSFSVIINDNLELKFDISTLKIDKGDTIILTFDTDQWDINNVSKLVR